MKRFVAAVLGVLFLSFFLSIVSESAAQTKLKYTIMPSLGATYDKGESHPMSPTLSQGLVMTHKFGQWGWATEAGIATPYTAANPAPQVIFGPLLFLSSKLYLNLNVLAKYSPVQKGKEDSLVMAGGFVFGVIINKETALGTGIGVGKVVSGEPGPWCFTFGPKLSFSLL